MLVATPSGDARVHVTGPVDPLGRVVLLHGAGTDSSAPLLVALAAAVSAAGWQAARVDMPHRVAGRTAPPPALQLDAACLAVVAALPGVGPLVLVGRSTGARVACRTALAAGASAVVALSYPLVPPAARDLPPDDARTEVRRAELAGCVVPVVVVQGSRDPFGSGELLARVSPGVVVHEVAGADHALETRRRDGRTNADVLAEVTAQVLRVLRDHQGPARR